MSTSPAAPPYLPASLRSIWAEAASEPAPHAGDNLSQLRSLWRQHAERALALVPGVRVEGEGEALYLGELSPGCRACKDGTWDCIFLTGRCNLACPFCCSPAAIAAAPPGSAFGDSPEEVAANYETTSITGVSFSGGEPLLEKERLYRWLGQLKQRLSGVYFWAYTNGVLADEATVSRLADLGLDELRFNLAATGWDDSTVHGNLRAAARLLPRVTVEVPAIPWQQAALVDCLATWSDLGVRHLNLHELMYEPGSPSASFMPATAAPLSSAMARRQEIRLPDGHRTQFDGGSRLLTLAVMRAVSERGLPLSVNDCSMPSKLRQLEGRRRSLAPLLAQPHERLRGHLYESYCTFRGDEVEFVHPADLAREMAREPDGTWMHLERTAPLAIRGSSRWVTCEVVECAGGSAAGREQAPYQECDRS